MSDPIHPGSVIRQDCLQAASLSVTEAARQLGVTRQTLNNLVNGKSAVSAEMAIRLEKRGWSDASHWLQMQLRYDLARVRTRTADIVVHTPGS